MIDEKARVYADRDWWKSAGDILGLELRGWTFRNEASFADRDTGRRVEMPGWLAERILQALSPGSTGETELHGPFGYLVCPIGLDESHWRFENDPEKDAAYVCLPVFTKEDPFERALLAAGEGRDE